MRAAVAAEEACACTVAAPDLGTAVSRAALTADAAVVAVADAAIWRRSSSTVSAICAQFSRARRASSTAACAAACAVADAACAACAAASHSEASCCAASHAMRSSAILCSATS